MTAPTCICGRPVERAWLVPNVGPVEPVEDLCARCVAGFNRAGNVTLEGYREQLRGQGNVVQLAPGCGWCGAVDEPLELVGEVRACATCRASRERKAGS